MNLLVDTHAFLWFLFADSRLSKRAERLLSSRDNTIVLSIASLWEIAIKSSIGKLNLGRPYGEFLDEYVLNRELQILDLTTAHLRRLSELEMRHRDPFDRLLIAQAAFADFPILTDDANFRLYRIKTLW